MPCTKSAQELDDPTKMYKTVRSGLQSPPSTDSTDYYEIMTQVCGIFLVQDKVLLKCLTEISDTAIAECKAGGHPFEGKALSLHLDIISY